MHMYLRVCTCTGLRYIYISESIYRLISCISISAFMWGKKHAFMNEVSKKIKNSCTGVFEFDQILNTIRSGASAYIGGCSRA